MADLPREWRMIEVLVRDYYACFNERRLDDAAALFTPDAIVEHIPFGGYETGGAAYRRFAQTWIGAFPDAVFKIERVTLRDRTMAEIDLLATGTHVGVFDVGSFGTFKPTGATTTLRLRELLDVRDGRIAFSGVSLDVQDVIQQLTVIDYAILIRHLERIASLKDELARVNGDANSQRDVGQRLGRELDEARHVLRPYFRR